MRPSRRCSRNGPIEGLEPRTLLAASPAEAAPAIPEALTAAGELVFFFSRDAAHGTELWKVDPAGRTSLVKDIWPGPQHSIPVGAEMQALGDVVFFPANDGVNGTALWKSDGTEAGTVVVADLVDSPADPSTREDGRFYGRSYLSFGAAAGKVFFLAGTGGDVPFLAGGYEWWQSDGTAGGTRRVVSAGTQALGTAGRNYQEVVSLGDAALMADDAVLWRTDGTPEGTVPVARGTSAQRAWPARMGGELFITDYTAASSPSGRAIFKVDEATGERTVVKDFSTVPGSPGHLTEVGGRLFFEVRVRLAPGPELWTSDGTEAGTVRVTGPEVLGGEVMRIASLGGRALIVARTAAGGAHLWSSDGTAAGTVPLGAVDRGYGDLLAVAGDGRFSRTAGCGKPTARLPARRRRPSWCRGIPSPNGRNLWPRATRSTSRPWTGGCTATKKGRTTGRCRRRAGRTCWTAGRTCASTRRRRTTPRAIR